MGLLQGFYNFLKSQRKLLTGSYPASQLSWPSKQLITPSVLDVSRLLSWRSDTHFFFSSLISIS